jgi:hypothetical protein
VQKGVVFGVETTFFLASSKPGDADHDTHPAGL